MVNSYLARVAGGCALVGGAAWVGAVILHTLQPRGCVGDECLSRPQREATTATSWLVVVVAVAMVAFALAVVALLSRSGELHWSGIAGVSLIGLGVAALLVMSLPQIREQTRPAPALVAIAVGLALVGWSVLRSSVVPTWAGLGLLGGILLLAAYTEQTSRVLFALPLGLVWLAIGVVLVGRAPSTPRGQNPSVDAEAA